VGLFGSGDKDKHPTKKEQLRQKNKKLQIIVQQNIELRQAGEGLAAPVIESAPSGMPSGTPDTIVWSAKHQMIRNRLTNKKRMAKERWNRFAGTAAAGARGL
jgi:hypothetical protein